MSSSNPYAPPEPSTHVERLDRTSGLELKFSGRATKQQIAESLDLPLQTIAVELGGSVLCLGLLLILVMAVGQGQLIVALFFAIAFLCIAYSIYRIRFDTVGRLRAEKVVGKLPWILEPLSGDYERQVFRIQTNSLQIQFPVVKESLSLSPRGVVTMPFLIPLPIASALFEDENWYFRLKVDLAEKYASSDQSAQPDYSKMSAPVIASDIGWWRRNALQSWLHPFSAAILLLTGIVALSIGGVLLYKAIDMYRSIIWTPYWTDYYNRESPVLWIFGILLTVVGVVILTPMIASIWHSRRRARYRGGPQKATIAAIDSKSLYCVVGNSSIQCDFKHVERISRSRQGLKIIFQSGLRFFVPRTSFINEEHWLTACQYTGASTEPTH